MLFGFLAFNGGSQLNISESGSGDVVALAIVNTFLSGSTSAFVTLFSARITGRRWSLLCTINGALAGMVSYIIIKDRRNGNILFNDALNTFYLRLYGVSKRVEGTEINI